MAELYVKERLVAQWHSFELEKGKLVVQWHSHVSEESRKGPRAINVAAGPWQDGPWQAWQGQLDDLTVAGPCPEAHAQYNKHALDLRTSAPSPP